MKRKVIVAVSGGPDSVFLLEKMRARKETCILAHVNHASRGKDSETDQELVEEIGKKLGLQVEVARVKRRVAAGFEEKMRKERYAFFRDLKARHGADKVLLAHTADDQVETVLMRVLEGAGVSGLKGIPRRTGDGIERPLLDTWREDILKYLRKHKIPYRVDRSNFDTRFERNWIRHVLIPLLEKRYGRSVKKRIFALGERFREMDELLEVTTSKWLKRHVKTNNDGAVIPRRPFSSLPSVVRKKVIQALCFERLGVSPNERLLESLDRVLVTGGPSARQNIGKGAVLLCRYDQAILDTGKKTDTGEKEESLLPGLFAGIVQEEKGRVAPAALKRLAKGERAAAFDADELKLPLGIRPLEAGDRIRPLGMEAEKKVKEVLIDRKVPLEERWGRLVVCDAEGRILWIPGVARSAHALVTSATSRTTVLRALIPPQTIPPHTA